MEQLVTLKFGNGSLETGLHVILQIGESGQLPTVELTGDLPPAVQLQHTLQRWQRAYRRMGTPYRLEAKTGFAKNVSRIDDCDTVARQLNAEFNRWLSSDSFRPLYDKLLERLNPSDYIRVVLQTELHTLQRLPWHTWALCDRYPKAEIALSAPAYERIERQTMPRSKVRILAILGHSQGLELQTDQALLNQLPQADVQFLVEPDRQQLNDVLWDPQGWDILFFAGHSSSQTQSATDITGRLYLNPDDSLTVPELKHGLSKAIERGLKIAIFNSCDGLGLAHDLADLQIPQVLVMREPVPDPVAHVFLKSFLTTFSRQVPFYLAVREAREKLQGLEDTYPCATWLPMIYQHLIEQPPTWPAPQLDNIANLPHNITQQQRKTLGLKELFVIGIFSVFTTLGLRQTGLFQPWELRGFDFLMQRRSHQMPDPRLLIVTVTEADIQAQDAAQRRGSLSDEALSALLEKLEPMQPSVIGLDIYRDFPVSDRQPQLIEQLQLPNLIATCQSRNSRDDSPGIASPPEVPSNQVGFSDVPTDADGITRRQLLSITPEPASPCPASYSLNALIALQYLSAQSVDITVTPEGHLQAGEVVFKPLDPHSGGYQGMDAGGHQILLSYRHLSSPDQIADHVTLGEVLAGRVNDDIVRDRIVLIGTTATSFGDYWLTPYSHGSRGLQETAGVFLQAHMVSHLLSTVLDGYPPIRTWPDWAEILWIVSWTSLGGVAIYGVNIWMTTQPQWRQLLLVAIVAQLSLLGLCWLSLTRFGYWLPWVSASTVIIITIGSVATYRRFQPDHV
ncbi:putative transmembrane sensor domain protein [Leptolyngbya sp. PCC 7375]|nr:putative transmembrane sensor domain protein [Leptolyngbya sp. PCC 7375]